MATLVSSEQRGVELVDILVVRDFTNVFPNEVSRLPP